MMMLYGSPYRKTIDHYARFSELVTSLLTWRHPADVNGRMVDRVHGDSRWSGWNPSEGRHLFRRLTGHQTEVVLDGQAILVRREYGQSAMLKVQVRPCVDA